MSEPKLTAAKQRFLEKEAAIVDEGGLVMQGDDFIGKTVAILQQPQVGGAKYRSWHVIDKTEGTVFGDIRWVSPPTGAFGYGLVIHKMAGPQRPLTLAELDEIIRFMTRHDLIDKARGFARRVAKCQSTKQGTAETGQE